MLKVAFSPIYRYELPEGHRFPMVKYELIAEQLLYEGTITHDNFFHPDRLDEAIALLTHTQSYWNKLTEVTLSKSEKERLASPLHRNLSNAAELFRAVPCSVSNMPCNTAWR